MGVVNIGRNRVSDKELINVLQAVCDSFQRNVNVIKGDRIPPRNTEDKWNPHYNEWAVDFRVDGVPDGLVYQKIKKIYEGIFSAQYAYRLTWFGPYSDETPCLCLQKFKYFTTPLVQFLKAGDTSYNGGNIWYDEEVYIIWGRGSYVGSRLAFNR